jgi:hypothetical protein
LASVTATGVVGGRPAAAKAATAGQSMHQTASTREVDPGDTHPPTARNGAEGSSVAVECVWVTLMRRPLAGFEF